MESPALKIIVASHNPVKIHAVTAAFGQQFPGQELEVLPVSVPSGVSDQPMADEESHRGARQRVENAMANYPQADYWVGMEGGLESHDGALMGSAWMVIGDARGQRGEARTPTLPLPPEVCRLVQAGLELGEANDRVFATVNSKQKGGAFGLLTEGRMTRESIYTQALVLALVPFVHPLWDEGDEA